MTVQSTAAGRVVRRRGMAASSVALVDRENVLGYVLMTPALLLLIIFIAYPFVLGVWYSLSDVQIFGLGKFIGLTNYTNLLNSPVFVQTVKNSFVYTGFATVFKLGLGLGMALVMNQAFPFKNIVRAAVLLPYIVPTALRTLAFLLAFNPTLSPLPWVFGPLHIPYPPAGFLGDPVSPMGAVLFVHVLLGTALLTSCAHAGVP